MVIALLLSSLIVGSSAIVSRTLGRRISVDRAECFAISMAIVLLFLGWLPAVLAMAGLSLQFALGISLVTAVICCLGIFLDWRSLLKEVFPELPKPAWAVIGVFALLPVVKALSPSAMLDWDTLAYHFAVPKLWLLADHLYHIPFIHHSNFPFAVDNLFMYGLAAGSETASKSMTVLFWFAAGLWIYGVGRRRWGDQAGFWAMLAFASCPLILWTSGSGYIDVAHGWLAAMGMVYAAEALEDHSGGDWRWALSALGLGGAMASKYTGLQTAFVVGLTVIVALSWTRSRPAAWRSFAFAGVAALAIASPWYIRNVVNTGNPVFPFFYEQLGGRGWDQWRADIYRNEQQTFGVGRTDSGRSPTAIGQAVFGLANQPGRFINPEQTTGGGMPMGAMGFVLLSGFLGWLLWGPRTLGWIVLAAQSGLLLILFFFLSQQARYVTTLAPVWALMLGSVVVALPSWRVLSTALIGLQGAYSWGLIYLTQTQDQLPVALGAVDRQAYQISRVPFAGFAPQIDRAVGSSGKVALFDEVFGYFLNVPYIWGNPGHSKLIAWETASTAEDLGTSLKANGITHIYLNLVMLSPENRELLVMALQGNPVPAEIATGMDKDLNLKWFRLICDAIASGNLEVQLELTNRPGQGPRALLFTVRQSS